MIVVRLTAVNPRWVPGHRVRDWDLGVGDIAPLAIIHELTRRDDDGLVARQQVMIEVDDTQMALIERAVLGTDTFEQVLRGKLVRAHARSLIVEELAREHARVEQLVGDRIDSRPDAQVPVLRFALAHALTVDLDDPRIRVVGMPERARHDDDAAGLQDRQRVDEKVIGFVTHRLGLPILGVDDVVHPDDIVVIAGDVTLDAGRVDAGLLHVVVVPRGDGKAGVRPWQLLIAIRDPEPESAARPACVARDSASAPGRGETSR